MDLGSGERSGMEESATCSLGNGEIVQGELQNTNERGPGIDP